MKPGTLAFAPATPERWDDLATLFGPSGAYAGCWCMWWRLGRAEFQACGGEGRRRRFRAVVADGAVPGILAYADDTPVGWCAVAPREATPVLDRSPVLKRVDDRTVWSITCFFVARGWRGRGVMRALIEAALAHAKAHGATIVEAYPRDDAGRTLPDVSSFTGVVSAFRACGFAEAARRSKVRPVMRRTVA